MHVCQQQQNVNGQAYTSVDRAPWMAMLSCVIYISLCDRIGASANAIQPHYIAHTDTSRPHAVGTRLLTKPLCWPDAIASTRHSVRANRFVYICETDPSTSMRNVISFFLYRTRTRPPDLVLLTIHRLNYRIPNWLSVCPLLRFFHSLFGERTG